MTGQDLRLPKELAVGAPLEALKKGLPASKPKGETWVLLSHQGMPDDEKLAKAFPQIDLILGAHTQELLQKPKRVAQSWIFQLSFRNQFIGKISLPFKERDKYELIALDAQWESKPEENPSPMDRLLTQFKAALRKIEAKRESILEASAPAPSKNSGTYQTFPRCTDCHLPQFKFWTQTKHSEALHALHKDKQSANLDCLRCHTVGHSEKGTWSAAGELFQLRDGSTLSLNEAVPFIDQMRKADEETPVTLRAAEEPRPLKEQLGRIDHAWSPVQCENCHGPAGEHPFEAVSDIKRFKSPQVATCMGCHTKERAPSWFLADGKPDTAKIQKKWESIRCPKTKP